MFAFELPSQVSNNTNAAEPCPLPPFSVVFDFMLSRNGRRSTLAYQEAIKHTSFKLKPQPSLWPAEIVPSSQPSSSSRLPRHLYPTWTQTRAQSVSQFPYG